MEDYLRYWDEVFAYWVKNGDIPSCEAYWDAEKIGLFHALMPEPYIGDPYNCSLVIMNYNPGAADYDLATEKGREEYRKDAVHHSALDNPDSMCHHYAHNYRERVAAGGYLGGGVDPMYDNSGLTAAGKKWWKRRLKWIHELAPKSNKLPFAIELCGWHSHNWKGIKFTEELLRTLKTIMAPAIEEAIRNSDLGVGLCVGAQWSWAILPAFGYKDVTGEVMGIPDYHRGWKPLGGQRNYCILCNDNGTFIINTWLSKGFGMSIPAEKFRCKENEMLQRIRALQFHKRHN